MSKELNQGKTHFFGDGCKDEHGKITPQQGWEEEEWIDGLKLLVDLYRGGDGNWWSIENDVRQLLQKSIENYAKEVIPKLNEKWLKRLDQARAECRAETLKEVENSEKIERLSCPFCNLNTSFGAGPEFFDQWRIKHDYHKKITGA